MNEQGKGKAIASLVLGIISLATLLGGYTAFVSIVLGIIGLVMAGKSKKEGYTGAIRTIGFILSLIGLIGGPVMACVSIIGLVGYMGTLTEYLYDLGLNY